MMGMSLKFIKTTFAGAAVFALSCTAQAEEIVVSNYGVSANGMPYAVAMEKGYFKEEGANVTGTIMLVLRKRHKQLATFRDDLG